MWRVGSFPHFGVYLLSFCRLRLTFDHSLTTFQSSPLRIMIPQTSPLPPCSILTITSIGAMDGHSCLHPRILSQPKLELDSLSVIHH
jgi:hypothetical protein